MLKQAGPQLKEVLRGFGCQLAQGYGISRPLPAEGLEQWLRARQPDLPALSVAAGRTLDGVAQVALPSA